MSTKDRMTDFKWEVGSGKLFVEEFYFCTVAAHSKHV